ncbi:MAG: hypothetical protein PHW69_05355 [Elusimicrobiaceae bacterium]|nr:hypothetical protein [Elusimicrobiaceae bacterium]
MLICDMLKKWIFITANLAILFWLGFKGYEIRSDSYEYINHFIYRPPGYPLLLDLFRAVFGAGYLFFVSFFQIAAVLLVSAAVCAELKSRFVLSDIQFAGLYAVLILPLFRTSVIEGGIGNAILPEALAYCVFMLAMAAGSRSAVSEKSLIGAAALAVAAVLLRPQLAFLYPAVAAAMLRYARAAATRLKAAALFGAFALLFLTGAAAERFYQLAENGRFTKVSVAPQHIAAKLLYFADKTALQLLPVQDRAVALSIRQTLGRKKLLAADYPAANPAIAQRAAFNDICWGTMAALYQREACMPGDEAARCYLKLNAFSRRVVGVLGPEYGIKVVFAAGSGALRRANWLTALFCVCFAAAVFWIKNPALIWFSALSALVLLVNCAAVEIFSDGAKRLYLYSDALEMLIPALTGCLAVNKLFPERMKGAAGVLAAAFFIVAGGRGFAQTGPANKTYGAEPQVCSASEIAARQCRSDLVIAEGFAAKIYKCPPCPPNASCKPCMRDNVVISQNDITLENHTLSERETVVFVNNPDGLRPGVRYKFTLKPGSEESGAELVAFEQAPQPGPEPCADCGSGGWERMKLNCGNAVATKAALKNCLMKFSWSSVGAATATDEIKSGYLEPGGSGLLEKPARNAIKVFSYRQWAADEAGNLYLLGQLG